MSKSSERIERADSSTVVPAADPLTDVVAAQSDPMVAEPAGLTQRLERHRARVAADWCGADLFRDRPPIGAADINLMSNDYLALAGHPAVVDAQVAALRRGGAGVMMSAIFQTDHDPDRAFEARMASLWQTETAILCQSGWAANIGLLQCISSKDSPVYIDKMAHASLWTGIVGARARPVPFPHNDVDALAASIRKSGPGVILVDTVYSMLGDRCPLREVVEIAERYGCQVVADESHALGVCGPGGAGLVAECGLGSRVAFRTASLSKAFCGRAGIIGCSRRLAEFFPVTAWSAIFSSSVLPCDVAGLDATLNLVLAGDRRRAALAVAARRLWDGLTGLGYPVGDLAPSHILAVRAGAEPRLVALRRAFESRGVFGAPFCPPATSAEHTALRLSLHSALSEEHCARILRVAGEVRDELNFS
ncbi:alpha-hydroxyketone-type quorum-sensing autoinducer synthase [Nocardia transvalensis]|uniref:alpha-hydroxyketone-type quorum-sensing autoinducer synthase n=1 Tax=Nocardia transvalensis TaxID=37333 RepID=UPI0003101E43